MRGAGLRHMIRCLAAVLATLAVSPGIARAVTVTSWGEGGSGQLGIGSYESSDVPVGVCTVAASGTCPYGPFLQEALQISASGSYGGAAETPGNSGNSLALLSNGTVAAWGENAYGQLGDGTSSPSKVPVLVCAVGWSGPCPSGPYLSGVVAVSAGQETSLALLENGTVVAWGDNSYDELGIGSSNGPESCGLHGCSLTPVAVQGLADVTEIAEGARFGLALTGEGIVMAWGFNWSGELGQGTWGTTSGVPTAVTGLSDVKEISAGAEAMALLEDGQVRTWGANVYGALGDGYLDRSGSQLPEECHGEPCSTVPVPVCAIGASGACPSGPYLEGVAAISAGKIGPGGAEHQLALLSSGEVVDWGYNYAGQLGDGTSRGPDSCYVNGEPCSTTPVKVCAVGASRPCRSGPYLTGVTAVAAGGHHSAALLSDGRVADWGENEHGELGDGTATGPAQCNGASCARTPVLVCAFQAMAYCPSGPYLEDATAISAGTISDLSLVTEATVPEGPYWYKKGTLLTLGGPHVTATTSAKLELSIARSEAKCTLSDAEEIWNPTGMSPGQDKITSFTFKCKRHPSPCPNSELLELLPIGLPWSSHLLSGSPVRDEIEGVSLEERCSGSYVDRYSGTLTPTVGDGTLEFEQGALKDGNGNTLVVNGSDKLTAPPGKVTAH